MTVQLEHFLDGASGRSRSSSRAKYHPHVTLGTIARGMTPQRLRATLQSAGGSAASRMRACDSTVPPPQIAPPPAHPERAGGGWITTALDCLLRGWERARQRQRVKTRAWRSGRARGREKEGRGAPLRGKVFNPRGQRIAKLPPPPPRPRPAVSLRPSGQVSGRRMACRDRLLAHRRPGHAISPVLPLSPPLLRAQNDVTRQLESECVAAILLLGDRGLSPTWQRSGRLGSARPPPPPPFPAGPPPPPLRSLSDFSSNALCVDWHHRPIP